MSAYMYVDTYICMYCDVTHFIWHRLCVLVVFLFFFISIMCVFVRVFE